MSGTLTPQSTKRNDLFALITSDKMRAQMASALPRHITPDRMVRLVLTEIRRLPGLLDCDRQSLLGAIMQSAQLGLEVGVAGQAWILPFKNRKTGMPEATLIPGYRGLVQLAFRSTLVAAIDAHAVFEGDEFSFNFGRSEISHVPGECHDPKTMTHVYAILTTTTGGRMLEVMRKSEIDTVRSRARAKDSGPWATDYVEMAKKTVLRRLLKRSPVSFELARAVDLDDQAESGEPQTFDFDASELDPDLAVAADAETETREREPGEEG